MEQPLSACLANLIGWITHAFSCNGILNLESLKEEGTVKSDIEMRVSMEAYLEKISKWNVPVVNFLA